MQNFKADLHIHSVLSPCANLEMSPGNIVQSALNAKLDIIAITDHNSTRQVQIIKKIAEQQGLYVIGGAEVNTVEEVHCLALFETDEQLHNFQKYLDQHLIPLQNNPERFGYQLIVDEFENIVEEEKRLLFAALDAGIVDIEKKVHSLDGIFIPAHIDRMFNGIFSQLGFIPGELKPDAFELSKRAQLIDWENNPKLPATKVLLRNSDAHQPESIGKTFSVFEMERISFSEMRKAFKSEEGRKVNIK
jgi:3',5'-nucleoside bisphosphate phosphatase